MQSSNVGTSFSMENSETICVTGESTEQLGLDLELKAYCDIVVKDLQAVPGPFQMSTQHLRDHETESFNHLSVDSVNGEFVPSFATPQMVKGAMDRAWKSSSTSAAAGASSASALPNDQSFVEVMYCDDHRKSWVLGMMKS